MRADDRGGYLAVWSASARGELQPLYGAGTPEGDARVRSGMTVLPGSWTLDASREDEALYVLLSPTRLPATELRPWMRSCGMGPACPPLPPALAAARLAVVQLRKDAP